MELLIAFAVALFLLVHICESLFDQSGNRHIPYNPTYKNPTQGTDTSPLFEKPNLLPDAAKQAGLDGEAELYYRIKYLEDSGAKILRNVLLTEMVGSSQKSTVSNEIDLLVINQQGLFVIECKNMSGMIVGEGQSTHWTQYKNGGGHIRFRNPILQNEGHIRALKREVGEGYKFYSVIAFSPKGALAIENKPRSVWVGNWDDLPQWMNTINATGRGKLPQNRIDELYHRLLPYTQWSKQEIYEHSVRVNDKNRERWNFS